jgi:hypothetical protein
MSKPKPPTKAVLARALCEAHPEASSKSLGRRLYRENVAAFPTRNAAYLAIRRARGNQGKHNRKYATNPRENQEAGGVPKLPPSQAVPWVTFELECPARVLSLADLHIPYHNQAAVEAAVAFGKKLNPDVVLLNGDLCDFYSVSRWDRDPKKRNFTAEVETCEDTLEWISSKFPKARKIFKKGNHEERYDKFIWQKAPELWGLNDVQLESILHAADYGWEIVGDQRPIGCGKLPIFHGHELQGGGNPVSPARSACLKLGTSGLVAHSHQSSSSPVVGWEKEKPAVCWSQGCLCDLNPEYARINKWNHGFAFIETEKGGDFQMHNYQILPGGKVCTA